MKKISLMMMLFPATMAIAQMDMGMDSYMSHDSTMSFGSYRSIGVSFQKFDGLNERIKKYPQYAETKEMLGTLGLGSIMRKGHFVSMGSLTFGYSMSGDKDKKSSSLASIGLAADFGYNFFKKESRVELFPSVGIGYEWYRAKFNKDNSAVPFDSVIVSPTTQNSIRSLIFNNNYLTYRFGLIFGVKSKDQSCSFGLQAGYTGGFKEREWRVNEGQLLQNAPMDELSRFYGSLYLTKTMNWGHKMH